MAGAVPQWRTDTVRLRLFLSLSHGSASTRAARVRVMQLIQRDEFPASQATARILDTPATGLIHLRSIAQPNVAALLPSAHPRSLRPADDDARSALLVRQNAAP